MDYPYLDTVIYDTFYEMLSDRYLKSGEKTAVKYFEKDEIKSVTYKELIEQSACVHGYVERKGFKDCNIAIFSENKYEYIPLYLGLVSGNVVVPFDKEMDEETTGKCLVKFDIRAVFYSKRTEEKIKRAAEKIEKAAEAPDIELLCIEECFPCILNTGYPAERFFAEIKDTPKDRFSVLATTSGTSGEMKGVMLSQYNIMTNIRGTLENNILRNPTLAFLPMNHTYGFNPCMLATFYNGTTLCLSLEFKNLVRDIQTFNPSFFGAVPMVIEGIYNNILREAKKQKKDKMLSRMIAVSNFLLKMKIDVRHILFKNLICPNLRQIVNGGAPLNSFYVERFAELGIYVLNGYGLTECSPTVAVSREGNNVPGSAGTIMKHIEVKTAEDGEILVKGPCVMLGYYKDERATREAMTEDGYLKTGDIGYTDGRLIYITGRKKNLIILENGKNVSPEHLESKLYELPYVKECLVVSKQLANHTGIICARIYPEGNYDSIEADLKTINDGLSSYMRIDDYEIVAQEFEKTSTGKIKR